MVAMVRGIDTAKYIQKSGEIESDFLPVSSSKKGMEKMVLIDESEEYHSWSKWVTYRYNCAGQIDQRDRCDDPYRSRVIHSGLRQS